MGVIIMIESDDYKIWFEGYGDIGRNKENLSGKAHLGKMISPRDEIFGEAEVVLDDVQWRFGTGYTHYWGKSGWSYVRRIPIGDNNYRLEYSLSPKWRLRAEHFPVITVMNLRCATAFMSSSARNMFTAAVNFTCVL